MRFKYIRFHIRITALISLTIDLAQQKNPHKFGAEVGAIILIIFCAANLDALLSQAFRCCTCFNENFLLHQIGRNELIKNAALESGKRELGFDSWVERIGRKIAYKTPLQNFFVRTMCCPDAITWKWTLSILTRYTATRPYKSEEKFPEESKKYSRQFFVLNYNKWKSKVLRKHKFSWKKECSYWQNYEQSIGVRIECQTKKRL